jgi:TRAP-type C4-dicarboxylate transport system permease small subunit
MVGIGEEAVVGMLFLGMLALMVIQVVARYLMEYPLPWSEELIRYLFVAASFLGGALVSQRRAHIDITIIDSFIEGMKSAQAKKRAEQVVRLLADIASLAIASVFTWYTYDFFETMYTTNQLSSAMEIPVAWVVGAMLAGSGLMVLHYIVKAVEDIASLASRQGADSGW